jgi:hypothetical protein
LGVKRTLNLSMLPSSFALILNTILQGRTLAPGGGENEQPRVPCSNTHAQIRSPKSHQQYLRWLLIEVRQWMQQHRAHQQLLRNILQPK